jgi:uncharacterized protein YycO
MRTSPWPAVALASVVVAGMIFYAMSNLAASSAVELIDMQADHNGDQHPDEFVAELQSLAGRFADDLDGTQQIAAQAALADFFSRIPLAADTHDIHAQAQELLAQQAATSDPAAKRSLAQQVDQLLQQAETFDPAYGAALSTIKHLAGAHSGVLADAEAAPDFSQLQRGDILLTRGGDIYLNWFYAQHYSHAGIYDGDGMVYESNPDGIRLKPLAKWQEPGHQVALARIESLSVDDVLAALEWAKETFKTDGSTGYNHDIPDKWTEDKLYCSQLVWRIIDHAGLDLDSNDFWYLAWITTRLGPLGPELALPAVLPDELALSDRLQIYSSGITQ